MKVRDLMSADVVWLPADVPIVEAKEIMGWRRFRHLPVVRDKDRLVGLVTHRDLLRSVITPSNRQDWIANQIRQAKVNIAEIMHTDVRTIGPDAPASEAARVLHETKFGCLPVVDDGRLVGIITEADFVQLAQVLLERLPADLVGQVPGWLGKA